MKRYTLIFLFNPDRKVLLINKGVGTSKHYNGLGGKIEPHEMWYTSSAVREMREESGLILDESDLTMIGSMEASADDVDTWLVTLFTGMYQPRMGEVVSSAEGNVEWIDFDHSTPSPFNLQWLVPFCWNRVMNLDCPHVRASYEYTTPTADESK